MNINDIILEGNRHFDYAVLTYVIHEVDKTERINLLNEIFHIADKVIIGDYVANPISGFRNMLNKTVEFAAGKDHYKNYKSYINDNGILGLAQKAHLKVVKEIRNVPDTSHIVMLVK